VSAYATPRLSELAPRGPGRNWIPLRRELGAKRGETFAPSAWEDDAETFPLFESGEYERAGALLRDAVVRHPQHAAMRYNLACAESRLGDADAALAHLERAIELDPALRESARSDPDLEGARADPRFEATA
jgi:tetratricopeptide (TPR) repeat protein